MSLLRSELLTAHGFVHGFSLRTGGTSRAPFDSLNLGRALGDEAAAVEANHTIFAEAVGYRPGALFEVSQVHGDRVRVVSAEEDPTIVRQEEADALVARSPGVAIGVRVADCVPVLLACRATGSVAAVHVGWRGAVAEILARALSALEATPRDVIACLGPHIRVSAFEVGPDVAVTLAAAAPTADVIDDSRERPHVDLSALIRSQLLGLDLSPEAVDDVGGCTFGEAIRFFSYRRDGRATGRHVAAIVSRA